MLRTLCWPIVLAARHKFPSFCGCAKFETPAMSCCAQGTLGYATPLDAFKNGPREKLLYVVAVVPDHSRWVRLGALLFGQQPREGGTANGKP